MKRLKKISNFRTLEFEIQIDQSELLSILCEKDNRLQPDKVTFPSLESYFGGVYKESNPTANENVLYAIEFVAYTNIDVNGESKTFIENVATHINYEKNSDEIFELSLDTTGQYISIFQFTDSPLNAIRQVKDTVTVEGLVLDYVAGSFKEAAEILRL